MGCFCTGMLATVFLVLPLCLARQELLEEKINKDPELSEVRTTLAAIDVWTYGHYEEGGIFSSCTNISS